MILQELIRNFILYRHVVRPILSSWKDSFMSGYYREVTGITSTELALVLNNVRLMSDGEELGWDISDEYEAKSVTHISGSRTITNHKRLSMNEDDLFYEADVYFGSASLSKDDYVVLVDTRWYDRPVNSIKTDSATTILYAESITLGTQKTIVTTTGFANQQINSFLFETHEKREYLGEFSLTHEEIPLLYHLKGGEYHDIR